MLRSLEEQDTSSLRRLVEVIAQKKAGVIDTDWAEICEDFDLDINAETLRKAGVGIKLADDASMLRREEDGVSSMSDGYVDRQKLRDLTRQVNKTYRSEARSELLREAIADEIRRLPRLAVVNKNVRGTKTEGERSLVLALGDFHYGAEIEVKGLRGETLNRYDHTVFEKRMEDILEQTVSILEKEGLDTVHVFLVGDLIDGMLRQSQLMRLEYGMVESTIRLSEYMAQWLTALSQFACVDVYSCAGNHSEVRPLKSKNREFEDENLEKIILWYLRERLAHSSYVRIYGDDVRMVMTNIEGYKFLLLHGDGEKSIDQIAKDAVNLYSEPIDFFICGHKHREQEFPMGMTGDGNSVIIRVPSVCGMDRYAQSKGYGGKPGAVAMVIEKGYGRRCVYPIYLQ